MTVADELESVIDNLAPAHQEAARELVAEIRTRPEEDQLVALEYDLYKSTDAPEVKKLQDKIASIKSEIELSFQKLLELSD